MIQAQLEFPDGGEYYFESHREELIGHNRPISTYLSKNVFRVSYGQHPLNNVEVRFSATVDDNRHLAATLTEMIPEIAWKQRIRHKNVVNLGSEQESDQSRNLIIS